MGLGVDFADVRAYVDDNDVGTAAGLWALAPSRLRGPARARLVDGRLRRGPVSLRRARRPAARPAHARPTSTPGASSRRCPQCGAELAWAPIDETAPARPAQHLRRHEAPPGAPLPRCSAASTTCPVTALRYHNVYGPRCPLDTPYAGVASLFRSAVARGRGRRGCFEDGGQTARLRPRARRGASQRAGPHRATALRRPAQRRVGPAADDPRSRRRPRARAPGSSPRSSGAGRLGDVRHIVASPDRAAEVLGFVAAEPFDRVALVALRRAGRRTVKRQPVALVAHGDVALVGLHEAPGDGQAEPGAAAGARGAGRVAPVGQVEHAVEVVDRDAAAPVGTETSACASAWPTSTRHRAARRGVADGVVEQVLHDPGRARGTRPTPPAGAPPRRRRRARPWPRRAPTADATASDTTSPSDTRSRVRSSASASMRDSSKRSSTRRASRSVSVVRRPW